MSFLTSTKARLIFSTILITSSVLFLFLLLFGSEIQKSIVFGNAGDFFADWLNVLKYISERNPYFNAINGVQEKIYPPLTYMLMYPFAIFTNHNGMGNFTLYIAFFVMMLSVIFLINSLKSIDKSSSTNILTTSLLLSSVIIFSVERGNVIIWTAGFFALFIAKYLSDKPVDRAVAIISLSLIGAMKVFPLLVGILWLRERRYKDLAIAAIITIILVFAPFFFFEGSFISNLNQLIINAKINSVSYNSIDRPFQISIQQVTYHIVKYFYENYTFTAEGLKYLTNIIYLFGGLSILLIFFIKSKWKQLLLIVCTIIFIPGNKGLYTGLYFLPVVILFFQEREFKKIDIAYMLLFLLFLSPLQFKSFLIYKTGGVLLATWVLVFTHSIYDIVTNYRKSKIMQL